MSICAVSRIDTYMMFLKTFYIILVWNGLFDSSISEECSSESSENVEWNPTNKEHTIEEITVRCECCIAVSHVLHFTFESAHKKIPDTQERLTYTDIVDVTGKPIIRNRGLFISHL